MWLWNQIPFTELLIKVAENLCNEEQGSNKPANRKYMYTAQCSNSLYLVLRQKNYQKARKKCRRRASRFAFLSGYISCDQTKEYEMEGHVARVEGTEDMYTAFY